MKTTHFRSFDTENDIKRPQTNLRDPKLRQIGPKPCSGLVFTRAPTSMLDELFM